jgi:hypothetical protein
MEKVNVILPIASKNLLFLRHPLTQTICKILPELKWVTSESQIKLYAKKSTLNKLF